MAASGWRRPPHGKWTLRVVGQSKLAHPASRGRLEREPWLLCSTSLRRAGRARWVASRDPWPCCAARVRRRGGVPGRVACGCSLSMDRLWNSGRSSASSADTVNTCRRGRRAGPALCALHPLCALWGWAALCCPWRRAAGAHPVVLAVSQDEVGPDRALALLRLGHRLQPATEVIDGARWRRRGHAELKSSRYVGLT